MECEDATTSLISGFIDICDSSCLLFQCLRTKMYSKDLTGSHQIRQWKNEVSYVKSHGNFCHFIYHFKISFMMPLILACKYSHHQPLKRHSFKTDFMNPKVVTRGLEIQQGTLVVPLIQYFCTNVLPSLVLPLLQHCFAL